MTVNAFPAARFRPSRFVVAAVLFSAAYLLVAADIAWLWGAATFAAALVGAAEWARLSGCNSLRGQFFYAGFFAVLAAAGEFLLFADASHRPLWTAAAIFWGFVAPWLLIKKATGGAVLRGALGMLLLYAAWRAAQSLYARDTYMLVAAVAAVCLFDIFAFFVGRAAGKTPLSQISPKKTVEGFLGGMTAVAAAGWFFRAEVGEANYSLALLLLAVFALSLLATVGDLFESALKRKAGVKESGKLLGEHGGVLDRIDGMLPVLPLAALISPWV